MLRVAVVFPLAWALLPEVLSEPLESEVHTHSSFPYAHLISDVVADCYTKLVKDASCCLDEEYPVGVMRQTVSREGTRWHCGEECLDSTKGWRGDDTIWVPDGASCTSPRMLWIHGGSWMYGSPDTLSYGQLASKLAKLSGAVIMVIDYPLAPLGNYTSIVEAAKSALQWLADAHLGWPLCDPASAPMLLGGDSSGGGSALSLALRLKKEGGWSPKGIHRSEPNALPKGQILAGVVVFSPWTNLRCDTPEYYYNAFARIVDTHTFKNPTSGSVYVGDLIFRGHPKENLDEFTANAENYTGGRAALLTDPFASPFFAGEEELGGGGIPPLMFVVGGSESILGDSLIVAQKAALYGANVHLDINVGMWHDFPMYSEGCGHGRPLWQAVHALNRSADFIRQASAARVSARTLGLLWPPAVSSPGTPHTNYIYDLTVTGTSDWFPSKMYTARRIHVGFSALPTVAQSGPSSDFALRVQGGLLMLVALLVCKATMVVGAQLVPLLMRWSRGSSALSSGLLAADGGCERCPSF